jgi:hypothetical protein
MRVRLERSQRLDAVMGEHERTRARRGSGGGTFCSTSASRSGSSSTTRMVAVMQPARAWYRSRGAAARKSIGLVREPTAPRSIALRRVSASP